MNIDDLISQAKCATVEACVMCDNHVQKWAKPKSDGCDKCHVGKLIEMINAEKEAQ